MGSEDLKIETSDERRTLQIVLWLNILIAIGFFVTGWFGDSNALLANGLDNSSDAIVYGLSLLALTRSQIWKRNAARLSGGMLLVFAVGVAGDAIRRYFEGSEPLGLIMLAMAAIAGVVNLIC
ncbi:MAG: cation transporter, partial [Roseibium sp.]